MDQRYKYIALHKQAHYGGKNHGKHARNKLISFNPQSVCDVGCGNGAFCKSLIGHIPYLLGIDFASQPIGDSVAWCTAHAAKINLPTDGVEWCTSFDMLEHLVPEEVDDVLAELTRISSVGLIVSICYRSSSITCKGEQLHMTVQPEEWWVAKLKLLGDVQRFRHYFIIRLR